jgi:hypothetical protein
MTRQWIDKAALHALPTLRPDSRIREIDTDDSQNKYGYLYNVYYPEDPSKPPVGVVYHKEKFYQFYHSTTTGNPYLGDQCKEANHFELFEDASKATDNHQMTAMMKETMDLPEEGDLLTKSPMATCRIMSPSPRPLKSELWDPCLGSSMEIEPEPRPSSPNSLDTWC